MSHPEDTIRQARLSLNFHSATW